MVVSFRVREISQSTRKLARTPILIIIIKKLAQLCFMSRKDARILF